MPLDDDPTLPPRRPGPDEPLVPGDPVVPARDPVVPPPADAVILPPDADADVVHQEERTRVLRDGSVVREVDRVEGHSTARDRLPWILVALLLLALVGGVAVWLLTRSSSKAVPAVVGLRIDDAVTRLQGDGFKVSIARQANAKSPGIVFGQNPAGSAKVDSGSTVRLLVSRGPSASTVPNAVGLAQSEGRSAIVKAGFAVTTAQVFSSQPAGTVVAQDPAAGERVAPGTKVRLNVSKGTAAVDVPSEVGSLVADAQSALAAKGFKPAVTRVASDQPVDTVVSQSPAGGQAKKGATVQLNVSEGPSQSTTTTTVPTTTSTTDTTGTTTTG
ncbi:MAG: eukaryotic-like serine/threonine-protein kinase [Gaiellales bacterium]|nr:eukaryotic-like serine/threonine-protein kinase [Gaiellales bacterium]